jgi:hypothetical protein
MKKPDAEISAKLWEGVRPECERTISMFINNGVKADRGKTKKETLIDVLVQITKSAYIQGLDRGYDMGFKVYGDGEE